MTKKLSIFMTIISLVVTSAIAISAPAHAATTALDTGTSNFDNFNLTSGGYFAFAVDADSAFTVESVGFLIGTGKTSADLAGSTVTFYSGHPSSPTNAGNLLGTLTFSTIVSEASKLRVTYVGSVSIPSAGRYWWKISNLASGKDIWVRMGGYTGHTGTWTAWNGTANWDLNGSISNSVGEYPKVLITGTAGGGSSTPTQAETDAQAELTRKENLKKLEEKQNAAKNEIVKKISGNTEITANDLNSAGYSALNAEMLGKANSEIKNIAISVLIDINKLTSVLTKYKFYEQLTKPKVSFLSARDLVKYGVITEATPMKNLTLYQLTQLPENDRDSVEKIDNYFKNSTELLLKRRAHLDAVLLGNINRR
jgi:hypothetical protein